MTPEEQKLRDAIDASLRRRLLRRNAMTPEQEKIHDEMQSLIAEYSHLLDDEDTIRNREQEIYTRQNELIAMCKHVFDEKQTIVGSICHIKTCSICGHEENIQQKANAAK